ncbi:MAG: molecular chaperone HtpG [Anaerolineae bacterium]|nr:molecular chaperone HtpG [Anaerolineae bacterium]
MGEEIKKESLEFKAEVQQLLNILSRSLYKERDIFLRELISNASDALHRLQFEMLTNPVVLDPDVELAIHVTFDNEAQTLTISDTGIGMTRDEMIQNLGTIAHSGAMSFLQGLEEGQKLDDIIGQFGVGFYAVFMVADEVRVSSRSYQPDADAWLWISSGDSTYTLTPSDKTDRGTTIEIQLKEDAQEFTSAWRLEQIIKKHSNYVAFPIYVEDKVANQQTALWRMSTNEIEDDAYNEFYRQVTLDFQDPLLHVHISADVPVEVRSILYIPQSSDRAMMSQRTDYGLKLYSRKILIQENNKDMLPEYLRFVEGVVDSADIPLNVARETMQSNRTIGHIKKALRGRLIKTLRTLGEEQPEEYQKFWEAWGIFIKEGVTTDFGGRDDLLPLLRFYTTKSQGDLVSLEKYVEGMAEDQEHIYYILGDTRESAERSPHLDYFKAHNLEVLMMVDQLDAFMIQNLREFDGKSLKNVDDPELELPEDESDTDEVEGETKTEVSAEDLAKLILRIKEVLGERVVEVRESKVLKDSPCRLVSPESGPEREMQRVRRLIESDYEIPPRILEVNRNHPLTQNLSAMVQNDFANPLIDMVIEQLFDNLLLLEGLLPQPVQMVPRIQSLLEKATASTNQDV